MFYTKISFLLAMVTSTKGYPIMWFFNQNSDMQYKGPKDVESITFFINEKVGRESEKKKVNGK